MKLTSPSLPSLFALSFFIAIGGCASSEDDTGLGGGEDAGSDAHGGTDTGFTTTDTGSHTDTGSTGTDTGTKSESGVCVSHCTSNAECDASCPASPSGSYNCCDTATGICYVSAGFCPAGSDSGGVDTAPY